MPLSGKRSFGRPEIETPRPQALKTFEKCDLIDSALQGSRNGDLRTSILCNGVPARRVGYGTGVPGLGSLRYDGPRFGNRGWDSVCALWLLFSRIGYFFHHHPLSADVVDLGIDLAAHAQDEP